MPSILVPILLGLTLVLVIGCFYISGNMNNKLNRMRRRYDMLLRGHSDINLEELLLHFSDELDAFKEERAKTEQKLYHVEQWMARTDTDQTAHVDERFATISRQITDEMRQSTASVMQNLNRVDTEVNARMNAVEKESTETVNREAAAIRAQVNEFSQSILRQVKKNEEDAFVRFDSLEKDAARQKEETANRLAYIEKDAISRFQQLENGLVERIGGLQTITQNRFQSMEQKTQENFAAGRAETEKWLKTLEQNTKEQTEALGQELHRRVDGLQKQTDERVTTFQKETTEKVKSESLRLREQLAMAIQKIYLYRYNAFEDVTGESSFSAVLLDEYRNGLIVTTIYSRENTNTFAKEIRSGEPLQKLSPEEEYALKEAMKR